MKIWIVGLPNVWKSTLFNALTDSYAAEAWNFPFCTIQPNIWVVDVKDSRVDKLAEISNSKKKVYANIKFVDIAWLVKWASKWEWMWNKFLSNIKEVDAIVQVLRYFKDDNIWHVHWNVNATRDADIINTELILADLEQIERKIHNIAPKAKSKDKEALQEMELLELLKTQLEQWKLLYDIKNILTDQQKVIIKQYQLLTYKPIIYAINVWLEDLPNAKKIKKEFEQKLQKPIAIVCAKLEEEMIWLAKEEKKEFLEDALWWEKFDENEIPTLDTLIRLAFDTVGLMYYFTSWEKETKAWTIHKWSTAPQAAWVIHTDFEKWFIKAEVINCEDIFKYWSWHKAKEHWKLHLEWKDYIVQDWDVIIFKFNVSKPQK